MNRGEIVEVDGPFSDRTGSKTRPVEACLKTVLEIR